MKKLNLLLLISTFILLAPELYAQAAVANTEFDKQSREAVMIQIAQSVDITADALAQRMKRAGLSGKGHEVSTYRAVILPEISAEKVDIYTKVEKGKEKNTCIVYMAVSKGYENFTKSGTDKVIFENMMTFLNSFVRDVNAYSLDLLIAAKLQEVKADEKRYENLLDDQKNLQKDKVNIENNIINKEKEAKDKKQELDRRKDELEKLKNQRSGLN